MEPDPNRFGSGLWTGLIYVGTDHGLYISPDAGGHYVLVAEVPNVSVYDLKVHPKARHLIIGTHGRSVHVLDVSSIQERADR